MDATGILKPVEQQIVELMVENDRLKATVIRIQQEKDALMARAVHAEQLNKFELSSEVLSWDDEDHR